MLSFRTALCLALPLASATILAAPAHAAAATSATSTANVKAGVDAWESGDFPSAVTIWRPLALGGDPDAQFNLGQAYKLGRGVPTDLSQAEAWYRRAAKQGHLQAEDNLGLVLFTAGRREEAMPYIVHSAERGEPRAQYVLGTAHFNGDLAAEDWPRAYALTKRASDAGLQIASARLAQLDRLIPLEQRQQGLAMLPEMEKNEQRARLAAVNAAAPPPPAPAPSPVQVASVPPSVPSASYTPPPVIKSAATPVAPAPSSPAAASAAAAASEATAAAQVASAQAAPVAPGTSYPAPPESGPLPPVAAPAPMKAAPVKPASPPQPTPVAATPAPAAANPWRAQLGAFGVEANARNLWASLEKKNPALAGRQPYLVKSGKFTRLQAGGFASKADAGAFCAAMAKGGQPCLVVDK